MCFRPAAISMEKTCSECGAINDFSNEVCDQCGATLPSAPPIAGMPGAPGAPRRARHACGAVRPEGSGRTGRAVRPERAERRVGDSFRDGGAPDKPSVRLREKKGSGDGSGRTHSRHGREHQLRRPARRSPDGCQNGRPGHAGRHVGGERCRRGRRGRGGAFGRAGRKRGMQRGGVRQEEQPRAGRAGQWGSCPQHRLR